MSTEKTVRQRWYDLHRARRVFLRDQDKHFAEVMTYGSTVQRIGLDTPASEYLLRAIDMRINPPLIVDPLLRDGGLNMYRPGRWLP